MVIFFNIKVKTTNINFRLIFEKNQKNKKSLFLNF